MKNIWKSIWAVFAGFLVVFILSLGTDFILGSLGFMPAGKLPMYGAEGLVLFILLYRNIYNTVGGYVTAKLAPHHPMRHAIIGGSIGTVVAIMGVIANAAMRLGPDWYAWGIAILALPTAWLGGKLALSKRKAR